jgi:hypothetical protein
VAGGIQGLSDLVQEVVELLGLHREDDDLRCLHRRRIVRTHRVPHRCLLGQEIHVPPGESDIPGGKVPGLDQTTCQGQSEVPHTQDGHRIGMRLRHARPHVGDVIGGGGPPFPACSAMQDRPTL